MIHLASMKAFRIEISTLPVNPELVDSLPRARTRKRVFILGLFNTSSLGS